MRIPLTGGAYAAKSLIADAQKHALGYAESLPNFTVLGAQQATIGSVTGGWDCPSEKTEFSEGNRFTLGDFGMQHFEGLVIGAAAETVDDGEAATIACACERKGTAIIACPGAAAAA